MLRVAGIQHDIVWEKPDENFAALTPMIEAAVDEGAGMVVVSEMWSTGFSMNSLEIAERPDGPTATFMKETAARTGAWLVGSFPELTEGYEKPTNRLLMAGPDGEDHRYSKIHPFTYAKEDEHYAAGRDRLTVEVEGVRVTPLICYDLRFPELWRAGVLAGAELFTIGASWPNARQHHWRALAIARAIENQAYVVAVNRVGRDPHLAYDGGSIIVSPLGDVLAEADDAPAVLQVDLDLAALRAWRTKFPALRDIKRELLGSMDVDVRMDR